MLLNVCCTHVAYGSLHWWMIWFPLATHYFWELRQTVRTAVGSKATSFRWVKISYMLPFYTNMHGNMDGKMNPNTWRDWKEPCGIFWNHSYHVEPKIMWMNLIPFAGKRRLLISILVKTIEHQSNFSIYFTSVKIFRLKGLSFYFLLLLHNQM